MGKKKNKQICKNPIIVILLFLKLPVRAVNISHLRCANTVSEGKNWLNVWNKRLFPCLTLLVFDCYLKRNWGHFQNYCDSQNLLRVVRNEVNLLVEAWTRAWTSCSCFGVLCTFSRWDPESWWAHGDMTIHPLVVLSLWHLGAPALLALGITAVEVAYRRHPGLREEISRHPCGSSGCEWIVNEQSVSVHF